MREIAAIDFDSLSTKAEREAAIQTAISAFETANNAARQAALAALIAPYPDEARVNALIAAAEAEASAGVDETARNAAEAARVAAAAATATALTNRADLDRLVIDAPTTEYANAAAPALGITLAPLADRIAEADIRAVGNAAAPNTNYGATLANAIVIVARALGANEVLTLEKNGEILRRFTAADFEFLDSRFAGARGGRGAAKQSIYLSGIVSFRLQTSTLAHHKAITTDTRVELGSLSPEIVALIAAAKRAGLNLPPDLIALAQTLTTRTRAADSESSYSGVVLARAGGGAHSESDYAAANPARLFVRTHGLVAIALPAGAGFDPRWLQFFPPEAQNPIRYALTPSPVDLAGYVVYSANIESQGVGGELRGFAIAVEGVAASSLFQIAPDSIQETSEKSLISVALIAKLRALGDIDATQAGLLRQIALRASIQDAPVFNFAGQWNPRYGSAISAHNAPASDDERNAARLELETNLARPFAPQANPIPEAEFVIDGGGAFCKINRFPKGADAVRGLIISAIFESGFVGVGVFARIANKIGASKPFLMLYDTADGGRLTMRRYAADGVFDDVLMTGLAGQKKRIGVSFGPISADNSGLRCRVAADGGAVAVIDVGVAVGDKNFASLTCGFDGLDTQRVIADTLSNNPLAAQNISRRAPSTAVAGARRIIDCGGVFTAAGERGQKAGVDGIGKLQNARNDPVYGIVENAPAATTRDWLLRSKIGGGLSQTMQSHGLPNERVFRTFLGHAIEGWYVAKYGGAEQRGVFVVARGDMIASGAFALDSENTWQPRFGDVDLIIIVDGFTLTSRRYRGEYRLTDRIVDVWVEQNNGDPYTYIRGEVADSIFANNADLVSEGDNRSAFEWAWEQADGLNVDFSIAEQDDMRAWSTRAAIKIDEFGLTTMQTAELIQTISGFSVRSWITAAGAKVLRFDRAVYGDAVGARAELSAGGLVIYDADGKFRGGSIIEYPLFERLDATYSDMFITDNAVDFANLADNFGLSGFKDAAIAALYVEVLDSSDNVFSTTVFNPATASETGYVVLELAFANVGFAITAARITSNNPNGRIRKITARLFSRAAA